jgi:hypothetical protein
MDNRQTWRPGWSIVSSSGRVIAMQIPDEAMAKEIVQLRAALKRAIIEYLVQFVIRISQGVSRRFL